MDTSLDPETQESVYVHTVYNEIAPHFSQTRYKPWPIVEQFLNARERGSIGIDVGCGNGKYIGVNKEVYIMGSDRSDGLIGCAKELGHEVMVADGLSLPHPNNRFDFAICIAVIHHFSTSERRTEAIKHILAKLKTGGEALVYVWALEQENSRRGYKEGDPQDVLVPWVLQKKLPKEPKQRKSKERRKDQGDQTDTSGEEVPSEEKNESNVNEGAKKDLEDTTKYRYYHLYKQGELEENAKDAGGVVVANGYERDNWYVVVRKA